MDNYIEEVKRRIRRKETKPKEKKYVSGLISRVLGSIIFLLVSLIFIKSSDKNLLLYKEEVLTKSLPFTKIKTTIESFLGKEDILNKIVKEPEVPVFNENLSYKETSIFMNGVRLEVNDNYLTPLLESGIVVFIGEKENYGNTVIVQGIDGIDIWYGNVTNLNVKMYEYVEKGNLLGETTNNELYLVFMKDGAYLNYEEHL